LVSELVTNVVLHAHTPCELRLEPGERLRVEVIDGSRRLPTRGLFRPEGSSGRGLLLVDALSADSGTVVEANGKRVWFELEWAPVSPA
jgi:anti-sigma regulatory factor (Ser/Thr protein kinase)